jgi:hypothetical protein
MSAQREQKPSVLTHALRAGPPALNLDLKTLKEHYAELNLTRQRVPCVAHQTFSERKPCQT